MRKEVADMWCSALRSGEFKQGKGHLERNDRMCVMGTLCLLALSIGVCDYDNVKFTGLYDGEKGRVPVSVQTWAELYGQNGEIKGEWFNLTWYNDRGGYSFSEIADIIEEVYERL